MSAADKMKIATQDLTGKAKEAAGKGTNIIQVVLAAIGVSIFAGTKTKTKTTTSARV
jgi:hypothetical protein